MQDKDSTGPRTPLPWMPSTLLHIALKEDMDFAVRAVNHHEALLAALERADDNLDTLAENLKAGLVEGALSLIERFRADARAAIAAAEVAS